MLGIFLACTIVASSAAGHAGGRADVGASAASTSRAGAATASSAISAAGSSVNTIPADSPLVRWLGRTQPANGSVFFDWEGVSASINLTWPFTWLTVDIDDFCGGGYAGGGSRWAVTITTADQFTAPPAHRIATFFSSPRARTQVMFQNQGGKCDPECNYGTYAVFTLTRLTESRVSGCGPTGNLSVAGFSSDGAFGPAPPPAARVLEFVGDSISAGDLNDGGVGVPRCGNIVLNDDITLTSGAVAARALGADSYFTAWGGTTVPGMARQYNFTFSAGGPGTGYGAWDFAGHPVDAVVVNLCVQAAPSVARARAQPPPLRLTRPPTPRHKTAAAPTTTPQPPPPSGWRATLPLRSRCWRCTAPRSPR